MEAALFANLVKTDPAAVLKQAKAATVPRTAAERYAAIGRSIIQTDPAQALPLFDESFRSFSRKWIEQDLVSYANWLNQQSDALARQRGAILLTTELTRSNRFQEAAEWAISVETDNTSQIDDVITTWQAKDPEAPARWLKDSDLPANRKAIFQSILDHPR